jgi:acetyl-CoA carboxylase carboxyl transferase subunit beta
MTPEIYFDLLIDGKSSKELFADIKSLDILDFAAEKKYSDQLNHAIEKTGKNDAISCVEGKIDKHKVIVGVMNFAFIGGSMGSAVGEIVSRCIERARKNKLPFILICSSGGARMQESAFSLMQLAKTSSKLAKFHEDGGLFIPILTDPTTGGVTASFGMLGDIILAEPGALIGFAGPRVIKQTIGEDLPEGFQTSEFLLEKGFIDHIVPRVEMKNKISSLIDFLS